MLSDNDTPVQPQLERSERRTQWVRLHKNYAEVELLWAMTKAVELLYSVVKERLKEENHLSYIPRWKRGEM